MAETQPKKESSAAAIIGWGGLLLFMGAFAWIIISQIQGTEMWKDKQDAAVALVRDTKPTGFDLTMGDLLKGYSLKVRDNNDYVGEFTWDAKQKNGPEYEVQLTWKENQDTKVAIWRVNLETNEIRPQGDAANTLPQRARDGAVG